MSDIRKEYPEMPVGRAKNLTGKIFGDYIVLYRTSFIQSKSKQAHWVCQCNICKKYLIKPAYTLINGDNLCECRNDLSGQKLGRWTVLYKTGRSTKNRTPIYHCKCDCGNEKDVDAWTLKSGQSKSCGCLQKENQLKFGAKFSGKNKIDLMGKRFGKLVALYPIYSNDADKHTKWHCKCDCGNECDIDMGNLRQGFSQSCGCVLSK